MSIFYISIVAIVVFRLVTYFITKNETEKETDLEKLKKIKIKDLLFRAILMCCLIISFAITLIIRWNGEPEDIALLILLVVLVVMSAKGYVKKFKQL